MYTSIRVKDMKKSVQFYTGRMGLKKVGERSPIPGETVVSLKDKSTGQRIILCIIRRAAGFILLGNRTV